MLGGRRDQGGLVKKVILRKNLKGVKERATQISGGNGNLSRKSSRCKGPEEGPMPGVFKKLPEARGVGVE